MNEVIKNIEARRSVRAYEDKEINREIMETIIKSGSLAATGANLQAWRFVVIENKETIDKFREIAIPAYKKFMENMNDGFKAMRKEIDEMSGDPIYYGAPSLVFVIGKKIMAYQNDCSMACGNMMLAARSFGIGTCWTYIGKMGINAETALILELKEDEEVFGPIVMGYPKGGFPEMVEKKEVDIIWR